VSKSFLFGLIAALMAGIAIFSAQNAAATVISFLFFQSIALPLGLVLIAAIIVGLFVPLVLSHLKW
jgi:uncharacterized integral membrane protein